MLSSYCSSKNYRNETGNLRDKIYCGMDWKPLPLLTSSLHLQCAASLCDPSLMLSPHFESFYPAPG